MNKRCDVYIICDNCGWKNYINTIEIYDEFLFDCNHCREQINIDKAVIKKDEPTEVS